MVFCYIVRGVKKKKKKRKNKRKKEKKKKDKSHYSMAEITVNTDLCQNIF